MTTKTKERYEPSRQVLEQRTGGYSNYVTLPASADIISYDEGPKYTPLRRLNWKQCTHTWSNNHQGRTFSVDFDEYGQHTTYRKYQFLSVPPAPSGVYDHGVVQDVVGQLDLNCSDSVLAYSGIIQAIPMLGGLFKLNRVLKEVSRHLKKGLRQQPFTTVVKSLISLDFIDRFVIAPTLDDARKAADAMNYVIRVIQTAHERNSAPFALQSQRVSGSVKSSVVRDDQWSGRLKWVGERVVRSTVTSKAFLLVEATYDTNAIIPLKLLAARLGLTKPLDSVWDLVPFSFVVDYFSKAGDFISALSNEMSGQDALRPRITHVYGAWGSLKSESSYTFTTSSVTLDAPVSNKSLEPGIETMSSGYFSRFPLETADLFGSFDVFPSLGLDMSLRKFGTLAELFLQAKL